KWLTVCLWGKTGQPEAEDVRGHFEEACGTVQRSPARSDPCEENETLHEAHQHPYQSQDGKREQNELERRKKTTRNLAVLHGDRCSSDKIHKRCPCGPHDGRHVKQHHAIGVEDERDG